MKLNTRTINLLMADNQLTAADMAARAGLSKNTACAIAAGRKTSVQFPTAGKIAAALGVKTADIVE